MPLAGQVTGSQSQTVTVPAAVGNMPGSMVLTLSGVKWFYRAGNGTLYIRPPGGAESAYNPGDYDGVDPASPFDYLELINRNAFPISALICVGAGNYGTVAVIEQSATSPNVVNPTSPLPTTSAKINIPDLSGQAFTDINGKKWLALSRVSINVSNCDPAATFLLQALAATTGNGPAVYTIPPSQVLRFDISGDYSINAGGANINCIVSETYQAIPAS